MVQFPAQSDLTTLPTALDRTTPVPLHHQVSEALRRQIAEGRYKPGDLLPPETAIARELGLARATVRQAIAKLVTEGLLTRRRGVGTAVARPELEQPLSGLYTFAGLASESGQDLTTQVLASERVPATSIAADHLHLRAGSDDTYQLERLRLLDGVPFALEQIVLPAGLVPRFLERSDLTRPLYDLLEAEYGVAITGAREQIRPVTLGQREARLLGLRRGAPAFQVDRTGLNGERAVEWRRSLIGGNRYLYSVELVRRGGSGSFVATAAEPGERKG
jgi:GntR family transcriptional regulator